MGVSLVNRLSGELVDDGHVEVVNRDVRPFAYRLTDAGREYRRRLSHAHFKSVLDSFRKLQERIRRRLREIKNDGVERLVFYGSGDVMEVTCPLAEALGLEVVGVVDDDEEKQGSERGGHVVRCPTTLAELKPDGVLITTLRHAGEIQQRIGAGLRETVRVLEL
jgi:hypothetical protein